MSIRHRAAAGLFVLAAVAAPWRAPEAVAKTLQVGGTHSPAEIKSACEKVGGDYYQNSVEDGGGYGCYEDHGNGNTAAIDCNDKGRCIATRPERPTQAGKAGALAPGLGLVDVLQ